MTQLTINIPNESDVNWVIQLLNRLHLDYRISNDQTISNAEKTEFEKNQQIIMNYAGMSESRTSELLDWVNEQRQDRPLPFRD